MFEEFFNQYPDYNIQEKPADEIIDKYQSQLPEGLIAFWKEYGFGSFMGGYLKAVNPDEFSAILSESYSPVYQNPIVMFATGLSDLIIWENNHTVLLDYRHGTSQVLESGLKYLFEDLTDSSYVDSDLLGKNFIPAKKRLGDLNFEESFGYVPPLGLGGTEKPENLDKVNLKVHISLIAQAVGKIG
ncbi:MULTISPECIES: T6SS immunity protein Tdi1 domain-containing protein [Sphingobacterium]|uniref:DUF1851 domain-containing protein n=1 Tax=Sphingobacterium athyrii TaxID=2152717 RepID=A0A363NUU5_9SPHI|nr:MULTISPECIES: T6SS immunity protein Tdi1 domain-containing protein [Sphingobacterium]PUV24564.1 hypothetical protein DCO56_14580 [Sphingobacterium athyrii]QIH33848.1 DUF1851 domain-containing protein [Sphingobacterium sp. DR205]